ncbi:UNVERIFIED_CONTAM: hypothetical protein HDU68_011673, partial [Siphonaria sp. JEL0065]
THYQQCQKTTPTVTLSLSQTIVLVAKRVSEEQTVKLVAGLTGRGLDVSLVPLDLDSDLKAKNKETQSVALLVSAKWEAIARIQAWVQDGDCADFSDATRLRLLALFLTAPKEDGGCGIVVGYSSLVSDWVVIHDTDWQKVECHA